MKTVLSFGPWAPDLPGNDGATIVRAKNVFASPGGWRAVPGLSAVTTPLAGAASGTAFVGSDGTAALIGGTGDGLYRFAYPSWSLVHAASAAGRWQFAQFGDNVIAVSGGAPAKYGLVSGSGGALGGSPPDAALVATVRDFVWLAGDPAAQTTLSISGFNDSEGWSYGTNQATQQPFPSGGAITGLAGGEYGLVLQKTSIKRGSYVGGETIWQFDEIAANIGCIASGSVAQAGRLVFFLSERGFMLCDGSDVKPIGSERVDRSFLGAYPRSELDRLYAAIDPRQYLVIWFMPGSPGRFWAYNWAIDAWSEGALDATALFSAFSANAALESLDTLFPDGLESVPVSLDSPTFAGGNPLLIAVEPGGAFATLSGDPLPAMLQTGPVQLSPGRFASVSAVRPMGDVTRGVTVTLDSRVRIGDGAVRVSGGALRASGVVPLRGTGRTQQFGVTIEDADWSWFQGLEVEFVAGEDR